MDCIPKYKPIKRPRKVLLEPPPYCRSTDKTMALTRSVAPVKLEVSDPSKILLLVESLNDSHSKGLEKKINKYLQNETESQLGFIISVLKEEAYIQVVGSDKMEQRRYKIPPQAVERMRNEYNDFATMSFKDIETEFQNIILDILGTNDCHISIIPILGKPQTAIHLLLVCLVNSKKDEKFVNRMVHETFKFCVTLLLNTTLSEEESKIRKECQTLLDVAKKLFEHLDDLGELLQRIMVSARNLTKSERCSLFLIDEHRENLVAKVFDGESNCPHDVKVPKNNGIAGHVFQTGEILNIADAYNHPLFYKKLDEMTGFRTRNILCFPIRDNEGVIGVAQLCNKRDGCFTSDDQETAMAFSIYCGLAIMHSLVYKKINEANVKTQLSNELMMYHMKVEEDAVNKFLNCKKKHNYKEFDQFTFLPRSVTIDDAPCYTLRMFEDLKLIEKFNIKKNLLCRFILYITKGYRDTPYHNYVHAFSVMHFAYLIIKNFHLIEKNYISHLDALALLTSCLGHDIDHRGTTNTFQLKIGSPLANLYSSEGSVMERHHLSQTVCILNTQGCNFLECLDNPSYQHCLDSLRDNILATDLANHFQVQPEMEIIMNGNYVKEKIEHKRLLLSLIMTCSDLSDQTKGFKMATEVAQKIYEEFFKQGDLEKRMGNKPIEMMDREKASIPDLQIEFIDDVCLPAFRTLAAVFPKAKQFVEVVNANRVCWVAAKNVFERYQLSGKLSIDVLMSPDLEDEVMLELEPPKVVEEEEEEVQEEENSELISVT